MSAKRKECQTAKGKLKKGWRYGKNGRCVAAKAKTRVSKAAKASGRKRGWSATECQYGKVVSGPRKGKCRKRLPPPSRKKSAAWDPRSGSTMMMPHAGPGMEIRGLGGHRRRFR